MGRVAPATLGLVMLAAPGCGCDLARLAHMLGRYAIADEAYGELDRLDPTYFDERPEDREMWEEARGEN